MEVCTVLCQQNLDVPFGENIIKRFYVCLASGNWSRSLDVDACSGKNMSSDAQHTRIIAIVSYAYARR